MRNLMNSNGHYYTLTNATSFYGLLYNILHIRISKFDEDMIKADVNLANSIDSTFISLTRGVIYDPANNPSQEIDSLNGKIANEFEVERIRPNLLAWDILYSTKTVTLQFSETVNVTSFLPIEISFQNRRNNPSQIYQLTGGETNSNFGTLIELVLSDYDLNAIKAFEDLLTSVNNSFISITDDVIYDMSSNPILSIPKGSALQVRNFNRDITRPFLVSSSLNLTNRYLLLSFDETVNQSTLAINEIVLSSFNGSDYYEYSLNSSTWSNVFFLPSLQCSYQTRILTTFL